MRVDLPSADGKKSEIITCHVRFKHSRFDGSIKIRSQRYPKKYRYVIGHTQAAFYIGKHKIATAHAWCSADEAMFDPAVGRRVAFRHLLEEWFQLETDRSRRKLMWDAFFAMEASNAEREKEQQGRTEKEREAHRKTVTVSYGSDGRGVHPQQAEQDSEEERASGGGSVGQGAAVDGGNENPAADHGA